MLIYKENNDLITTSLGNPFTNMKLLSIRLKADQFNTIDNQYFKIVSTEPIKRDLKHITRESLEREARRRFRELTDVHDSLEYYDQENDVWYRLFPYMKDNPTIFTYRMIYPAITEFFQCWKVGNNDENKISNPYDLSKLFTSMDNFRDLSAMFMGEEGEKLKNILYERFPQFAIFYYEIYPYINMEVLKTYDITKLINARMQVSELGMNTDQFDGLIDSIQVAENNGKVLNLIKQKDNRI